MTRKREPGPGPGDDREEPVPREQLQAWEAEEPADGFADRVLAARDHGLSGIPDTPAGKPLRRPGARADRLRFVLGACALAAAGLAFFAARVALSRRDAVVATGQVTARDRATLSIGRRATAVAEAGADVSWRVDRDGAARVVQAEGDVFYRVEPGGAFIVATPAGDVHVTGTCFRVEVMDMRPSKQAVTGGIVGAALTATVLVTVYEGKVILANEKGKTEVKAGERSTVGSGGAPGPALAARGAAGGDGTAAGAAGGGHGGGAPAIALSGPPDNATREELLARDKAQRAEIARLRAELGGGDGGPKVPLPRDGQKFFDFSHDELVNLAKDCSVRFDSIPIAHGGEAFSIPPKLGDQAGLSPADLATANGRIADLQQKLIAQLRALYVEVTGNAAGADELSPEALQSEITQKSKPADRDAVMAMISREKAGLQAPPADLSTRPPVERMYRLLASFGDVVENDLALQIGPEKAHALRSQNGGWPQRWASSGCAGQKDDDQQK